MQQNRFEYVEFRHYEKLMPFVDKYTFKTDVKYLWIKPLFMWVSKFFLDQHRETTTEIESVRFSPEEFSQKFFDEHPNIMNRFDDRQNYRLIIGADEFDKLMQTSSKEMCFEFTAQRQNWHGFDVQVVPWLSGVALIPKPDKETDG